MTAEEKKAHFSKIMGKIQINTKFVLIDVTPKGYGPEEN
jgi:hypothetical protein